MDGGAQKLLEEVTIRTLHAQNFSRSSTQASLVLTDLLSRYLTLLTSLCGQYAGHSGRNRINARDVVVALDELGVNVDELKEFCSTEGLELNRYALYKSHRRVDDLRDFKGVYPS
jgi:histone H3/H4